QEEGRDHRQHDRDRIGEAHGDDAVLADEEIADEWNRNEAVGQPRRRRIDTLSEQPALEQLDERLRAEYADEEIQRVKDGGEDRQGGGWAGARAWRAPLCTHAR